ncbi:MAG: hypothetical protein AAGD38_19535 [Acidobacteriota bacterium]
MLREKDRSYVGDGSATEAVEPVVRILAWAEASTEALNLGQLETATRLLDQAESWARNPLLQADLASRRIHYHVVAGELTQARIKLDEGRRLIKRQPSSHVKQLESFFQVQEALILLCEERDELAARLCLQLIKSLPRDEVYTSAHTAAISILTVAVNLLEKREVTRSLDPNFNEVRRSPAGQLEEKKQQQVN